MENNEIAMIADSFTADEVLYQWDSVMPLYINNGNIPVYALLRKPTSAKTCVYTNHVKGTYRITGTR